MAHSDQQLDALRTLWRVATSTAARRAGWSAGASLLLGATLLGRLGSDAARLTALLLLLSAPLPWLWLRRRRRAQANPGGLLRVTLARTEPALGAAALRALALREATAHDAARGSATLAQLHLVRLLDRAAPAPLIARAARTGWVLTALALVLATAALAVVLTDPLRPLEGLDVLAARAGEAPVAMRWVAPPELTAEPPSYLGLPHRPLRPYFPAALPVGSTIVVRAEPLHRGRELMITDGQRTLPFRDDADGGLVAHWPVRGDATLTISARFGEVLIDEPEDLQVHALADYAPAVRLEGAPATHRLLATPRVAIHWEARDDHGLSEIDLVLRAGEREERRPLSKPRGGARVDRGGIELHDDDPFISRTRVPVRVTVEALDADPVSGPKWGSSEPIVLIPPAIAEAEALRFAALREARDEVVDVLAARFERAAGAPPEQAAQHDGERARHRRMRRTLGGIMGRHFGSMRFGGRVRALVRGQVERVLDAVQALVQQPTAAGRRRLIGATEQLVLAVDSALGAIGFRDTRAAAREMAQVALDAAAAIGMSGQPTQRRRAERRLDADLIVLGEGGGNLLRLGALGQDLGEIVAADLRRIRRALERGDRRHARLAAEDLAARLQHPGPSFGAAGGRDRGSVEAGSRGKHPPPSDAARAAAQVDRAIAELAEQHEAERQAVSKALDAALDDRSRQRLREELRAQAQAVREAVSGLPQQASQPDSARAAAAEARSRAEGMAAALERGELDQAVAQGEQAVESLKQAMRRAAGVPPASSEQAVGEAAREAHDKLRELLERERRTRAQTRQQASEAARSQLERSAERERQMGERARAIARQSAAGEAPLPGEMLERLGQAADAMDRAGRALGMGQGHQGLTQQQQAQRLLEMSQPEAEQQPDRGHEQGAGGDFARDADVPDPSKDPNASAFRRRVTAGMRHRTPAHLRGAARRYTEGLLR